MTPERIAEIRQDADYRSTYPHDYSGDVIHECLDEIERLKASLPPSDDGEPVTADWLESVGLLGEHDLQGGMRLCFNADCSVSIEYSSSGWYREFAAYELDAETRGDDRALARLFRVKLREGDE